METIGVRELQQHASKALERVAAGETLGVTARGRLVAVLSPPAGSTGIARVAAEGRLKLASKGLADMPPPRRRLQVSSADLLNELRGD